ncbi:MAG: lipopolysaccharide biosynthesis protein [Prevotella sp.]|nr:lipopolysaccharide biosynthesis protein [Prevotella sp.]
MKLKRKIYYLLHSGKNSNQKYFAKAYLRKCIPSCITRMLLKRELAKLDDYPDKDDILKRVDYYCKLSFRTPFDRPQWEQQAVSIRKQPVLPQKVYYFDAMEIARYFNQDLRWILKSGDIIDLQPAPTLLKSRPLGDDNQNSVLMKLVKVRHFLFVNDQKPWREKKDMAIFRGDLGDVKYNRDVFMNRWYGHPMIDAAATNIVPEHPEWQREKLTIGEHLDYKFVMSLEGNDVASNLKWIMSSNSIAVTPRLTCETWFMEGTLIPNYHYIEIKDDFSDLEERLTYYIEHPDEAEAIIRHAHEYVKPFKDQKREKLISLLVLKKYLEVTNQVSL